MKTTRNITLTLLLMSACIMNAKAQCIANAGNDTTVCGYTVDLHGTWSHNAGAELLWTSTLPNVYFSDPTAEITTVVIPNYMTPSYQVSFIFTETIPPGICVSSDTVVVTFLKPPHAEAGPVQHVCGYTATLNADTLGSGISSGSWSCNIPGIIFTTTGGGVVPAAYSDVDATGAAGQFVNSELEAWCYWTGTNSLGCSNTDSVMINFFEIPDAYAGEDDSICGKTYDLAGQFSLDNPTGSWSILTRPYPTSTANFIPSNSPDANVTVSDYGCYTFVWTEMNAGNVTCMDKDTISICFTTIPHPDAGLDQSVCGSFVELTAVPTPGTTGYWQGVLNAWYDPNSWPNDTIFCMPCSNDPNVVACYSSENDTVTYYWMEFDGVCYGYDSVNVYFGSIQPAISLVDPADSVACGRSYYNLNAQAPAYGNGYWYDDVSLTQFYPNNYTNTPDSTVISSSAYGLHNFYWVTVNGNCRDTSDVVSVFFGQGGSVEGVISGLGGYTDYTVGLHNGGSPLYQGHAIPDASGNYTLTAPAGTYFLKVTVDNPDTHPGIASTYYNSSWLWNNATKLTIIPGCGAITRNITMYTFPLATGGLCRAYGTVMYDNGGPVENANVYLLYKPVNTPAILELTNASGYYSLNDIPQGNYKIQVDIPGLPQVTTHHITVNSNDTLFPDVNFIVDTINISKEYGWGIYADSNLVYGIGEPLSVKRPVHIYPVPFSTELFMESYSDGDITIEWYSQSGEMLSVEEMSVNTGNNSMAIPAKLSKGVYYLKVVKGNTIYVKKLIKE